MPSERFERGQARQQSMRGPNAGASPFNNPLADIFPEMTTLITEFIYGDIHSRPGLDAGQRELVTVAVLTALGDTQRQIETHVGLALGAGVPAPAIVEAVVQTIPYVGFPRAIQGLTATRNALERAGALDQFAHDSTDEEQPNQGNEPPPAAATHLRGAR
jgi:4-carboxymuconolactone decarboxylase